MEVAGWVVGPIVERLINAGIDYLNDQVGCKTHVKEELERLQYILPSIQAVVAFASSQTEIKDQNPALNKWLWQLRDAIDEADDVLDDFEYMKHEQHLTKNNKKRKICSIISSTKEELVKRLEEVVKKLDKVSARVSTFLYLLQNTKQEQLEQQLELYKSRETGPLPKNDLIGRGNAKEFVMQWLSKPSNEEDQTTFYKNISLLSIVGHGGMGKTTLLQHVYEDVKTKEFPLKMWVCVSNNFDAKKVIADMLEYLKNERPRVETLGRLQESLKSEVNSKKFLLVLDDIWEEVKEERNKRKWEDVLAPLASGSLGSKILITTRMDSVALMIAKVIKKKNESRKVEGLEEKECLQLLNTHAFAGVENPDDHKKLRDITGKMVKKLSGSPLAAKVMGGILNSSLDDRFWDKVLNRDIGSLKIDQNDILPILRLSYTFLNKPLQSCFAFCGIFKQDHVFDKDDLVRMWIALGFIQPIQGETIEDIGGRYFDILVKKSFFDKFRTNHYKMHDLLHELAQSVSAQECLRVEGDKKLISKTSETIRHLFLKTRNQEELKKIEKFKNLRSLYLIYEGSEYVHVVDVIAEIFKATRSIRLLYLCAPYLKMIPEAIEYLTHLRYLELWNYPITQFPRSLSNLFHLQFIICNNDNLKFASDILPRDINNLSNLRCLKFRTIFSEEFFPKIHEIGKLTSLQELDIFYVGNEPGYRIGELEQMNDLRKLRIDLLENMKDAQEARNAKLRDKRNLTNLSLKWGDIKSRNLIDLDEKVLDNLQPPSCLKNLEINEYMGARSAIWMNMANSISNLEFIKLDNCLNWQTLLPFGQLPFLKSLHLHNMAKVKRLDNKFHGNDKYCDFPSLEVLQIKRLEALENWFDAEAAEAKCLFPCLIKLYLEDCPNLQDLPYLPPKLKQLEINNIGWKTLNCCSISKYSPLEELFVWNCPMLISLGGHQEVETTENCLEIDDPSILLMEPLRSITSLEELNIENNDKLVSFPIEIEAEQWFLKVSSSLQSLPSSLESLSSLKSLNLYDIPKLQRLPNLPASLERLTLNKLESLQCTEAMLSLSKSMPDFPPSSLKFLRLWDLPLQKLPDLPPSLCELNLCNLPLRKLPDLPPSLCELNLCNLPLQKLPDLPPSLCELYLCNLPLQKLPDLPPSLRTMFLFNLPLQKLPDLPPSLWALNLCNLPLQKLPDLPPSLCELNLNILLNLDCLPSSLPTLSSLQTLSIGNLPQLQELPNLPPSLAKLDLRNLDNLDCLPSCFPILSSLRQLDIKNVPQLRYLPDLPSSLKHLIITKCHPELKERYQGSDSHAHIPFVIITTEPNECL